jgi:hypothetical protein
MSLVIDAFLLEKYGPRLDTEQLAEVLGTTAGTIRNQISAGTFPVKTYTDGNRRFADYRDVSAFFDEARMRAVAAAQAPSSSPAVARKLPTKMSLEQAGAMMLSRLEQVRPKTGNLLPFDNAWNGVNAYQAVVNYTIDHLWKLIEDQDRRIEDQGRRIDALEARA